MKRLLSILLLVFSMQAGSEESMYTTVFTSLCISDHRTGFNYAGGKWTPVDFRESRWVIQKVKVNQHLPVGDRQSDCQNIVDAKENAFFERLMRTRPNTSESPYSSPLHRQACYLVKEFNGPKWPPAPGYDIDSENCTETIKVAADKSFSIKSVNCKALGWNIYFQPSGEYRGTIFHDQFNNKGRDSLAIEVGKCSMINGSNKIEIPEKYRK